MSCCCVSSEAIRGTNKFFSKQAKSYVRKFHKRGLAKEQRYLLEGILLSPIAGRTVLEIGCGVGALQLTLLKYGALSALGVDISEGMIEAAEELSRELGFTKQTLYRIGDFVRVNEEIPDADIVILDKVVCCYADIVELLKKSCGKSRSILALSYPRPKAFVKLMFLVPILLRKLLKWPFHPYWHDWSRMVQKIEEAGFEQVYERETIVWTVRVFEK